ncbi:aldo/keto reductase [Feifania hominis]|uniref:Aldo/keto reductase n=1 Tax=Feifania hominis TaxID=2763660 RepID=A0A926DEH5_9FIRM|nr:aldo/keto reductase [Feifania hominis]MBC8536731.1 aldo/keto reductase [Feifania hominis]
MQYRPLGNTGMMVSEIGLGCEHLEGKPYEVVAETVHAALEAGVNLLDVFMSEPQVRSNIGRALESRRDRALIQGHIRAVWQNGQYGRTMDVEKCRVFFEDLLTRLRTDYLDIGFLHLVDTPEDFERIFDGPILEYALELKSRGVIRALGMSSHNPVTALRAVESGLIDVLFFPINAAYDLLAEEAKVPLPLPEGYFDRLDVDGINPVRGRLYRTCERQGVGITVMKSLAAGALLNEKTCPFGRALSVPQCIHYALTRPGVSSVLVGMKSAAEVEQAVRYETMDPRERDYSEILSSVPRFNLKGQCMYCNHCLPCPKHIDIAQVGKYLDLALVEQQVSPTVRAHYEGLAHTAGECIACGSCEKNCPFEVPVMERMRRAAQLFGR